MDLTQDKIDLIGKIIKKDRKYPNNEDLFDDFFNETCKRSVAIFENLENEASLETYLRRVVTTSIINVLKDSGRLRRSKGMYVPTKEVSLDALSPSPYTVEPVPTVVPVEQTQKAEQDEIENVQVQDESSFEPELPSSDLDNVDLDLQLPVESYEEMTTDSVLDKVIPESDEIIQKDEEPKAIVDYSAYNISYLNVNSPKTPEDIAIQKEALEFVADTIKQIDKQYPEEGYLSIYTLRYDKGMTQNEIASEMGISQSEVSKRLYGLIAKVKNIVEN